MSRITPISVVSVSVVVLGLCAGDALAGPELKKSQVLSTVKEAMPDILACGPELQETITAKWTISQEGEVVGVKIDGKHAKDAVGKCMKKHLSALRFGHSIKSTPVTFPFHFGVSAKAQPTTQQRITGKLSKKDLDGLLTILEGDLKKCGEGTVRAKFTINPKGFPKDVQVEETDEKTAECVTKRVARVRFPSAAKPTSVERSFLLEDESAESGDASNNEG